MRTLTEIFDRYGVRGSFNVEVMQQLNHRRLAGQHNELAEIADAWEAVVTDSYRRGHDIQLHIHPQWSDSSYEDRKWHLGGDWSILNYDVEDARRMIVECRDYLETLIREVDPEYRCLTFRSGSWCIAPSDLILNLLAEAGIVFDMSIVGGVRYDTKRISLDYRRCEEDFLPYYPVMTDARRVSDVAEKIISVPTNHFFESRTHLLKKHLGKLGQKLSPKKNTATTAPQSSYYQEWAAKPESLPRRLVNNFAMPYLRGRHHISDIAQLDLELMLEMLESIRRRAKASGYERVPVILENHTKDISDFSDIENFVAIVAGASDIQCVTLTEMARSLQSGEFPIRTGSHAH